MRRQSRWHQEGRGRPKRGQGPESQEKGRGLWEEGPCEVEEETDEGRLGTRRLAERQQGSSRSSGDFVKLQVLIQGVWG